MVFSVSRAIDELDDDKQQRAKARLSMVHQEQYRLGMTPRDDSRLSFAYAIGDAEENDSTPQCIANELYVVDHIYKKTDYAFLLEAVMRAIALHIRKKYRLTWTTTWDVTKFYVPSMMKMYCLHKLTQH